MADFTLSPRCLAYAAASLVALSILLLISIQPGSAHPPDASYIHPPVHEPLKDGISLTIPDPVKDNDLSELGLVDVTAKPFHADPSGEKDSTHAIQTAVNFARDHQMVCFFPPGAYLVTDTIECIQNRYRRVHGAVWGAPNFPCMLYGSRKGPRPRILLAPDSKGFGDPAQPKHVIHFWTRGVRDFHNTKPNSAFNQSIENIEVVIGKGNSGAVGIRMRAAQGSNIISCSVDATEGFKGFEGGPGSGGSITDLKVFGGRIGMDMTETQPAPTITGVKLIGQTEAALIYGGRQSLCAVGMEVFFHGHGPAIRTPREGTWLYHGQLCMLDASILYQHSADAAIVTDSAIYLSNVYVKGARNVLKGPGRAELKAGPGSWTQIREFAAGPMRTGLFDKPIRFPVYLNKEHREEPYSRTADGRPPDDLCRRHLWKNDIATWESPNAVNVKSSPYNAHGDGRWDDTRALQKAIDENDIVFLPKGYYYISKPLQLRTSTKLVGVAKHLSIIMTRPKAFGFRNHSSPNPLIRTAEGGDAMLSNICLHAPKGTGSFALQWLAGKDSMFRFVNVQYLPVEWAKDLEPRCHPFILVEGPGGGKWYGLYHHGDWKHQTPDYRLLLVQGASGPLKFYHLNLEHASSDANMEIRSSNDIDIYGMKSEGNKPVLIVSNSQDIGLFGYGGNASALPGQALFILQDSSNVRLVNLVEAPRAGKGDPDSMFGVGVNPGKWHMVDFRNGKSVKTKPFHRPVLYLYNDKIVHDDSDGDLQ